MKTKSMSSLKQQVNRTGVFVSAVVNTALGFLWFAVVFRMAYVKGLGKTAAQLAEGPGLLTAILCQLLGNIVLGFVLLYFLVVTGSRSPWRAVKIALLAWMGFVASVTGPLYAFEAFSISFFFVTTGYTLLTLLVSSLILSSDNVDLR